ncbi:flagellar biosynthetic protein FliO [Buchnera aphidicola]|uniref:flagellar biosynthetic protein FliO n=1 Tax=Buchnera aphidicola TaxID=9 RepID=UPI003463F113
MKNNASFQTMFSTFQSIFNNEKFFQIISSLSQIILLILVLSWILRKISFFKFNNMLSSMKVIDRLSVGSHEYVVLIEVEQVKLVLGVTAKNITYLYTLSSTLKENIENQKDDICLKKKYFKFFFKKT